MNIPNIFHFCWWGGQPFSLVQYIAAKSAYVVNKPDKMFLYTFEGEPESEMLQQAKDFLEVVEIVPRKEINGIPITLPAHQADIVRLEKLIEHGGIYIDLDVICRHPFKPLMDYSLVLGREEMNGKLVGLCNAVILSQKGALFARRWLEGFDATRSHWQGYRTTGKDAYYSEYSVKYPNFLSTIYPEELHIEPSTSFFYPNYSEEQLYAFFETEDSSFEKSFCHHLWYSASHKKYLDNLSEKEIMTKRSSFHDLARKVLTAQI